jgi:hypothetical protein
MVGLLSLWKAGGNKMKLGRVWIGMASVGMILLLATASLAQELVTLAYKFSPKQTIEYSLKMSGTGKTSFEPATMQPQLIILQGDMDIRQVVKEVMPDDSAQVEITAPKMLMNATLPGQTLDIKWQDKKLAVSMNGQPQPIPEGTDFSKLPVLGVPIAMRISKTGKVMELKLPDMSFLNNILGNMNLAELVKAGQNELPDHPIKVGESWTVEQKIPLGGSDQTVTTKTIYTLAGFENLGGVNTVKLDFKSSTQVAGMKMPITDAQGKALALTMDLKQEVKGATWFNQEKGQPAKSEIATTLQEIIKAPAGGDTPEKTTVDMNMKLTMTIK